MPYTGSGAGTIGDPYLITTKAEFLQLSTSTNSNYFKLVNNIDIGSIGLIYNFAGKLDGNNKTITNILSSQTCLFSILNGAEIKDIKIELSPSTSSSIYNIIEQSGFSTGVLTGITVINPSNWFVGFCSGNLASELTVNNIKLEGAINRFISGTLNTPISNISINITKELRALYIYILASTINANVTNVQILALNIINPSSTILAEMGVFTNTHLSGIISNSWFKGSAAIKRISLVTQMSNGAEIKDCYFYGQNITSSLASPICNQGWIIQNSNYNATYNKITRCYVYIEHFTYPIKDMITSGNLFDDLGYNDWYIPSSAELTLIRNLAGNSLFSVYFDWNSNDFRPMSSTEDGALQYKRRVGSSAVLSADKITTAYTTHSSSLVLVRNLIDIPANKNVGEEYDNTVIIYKNGTTGIGSAKIPVANGAAIFNFGGTTLLNTTDGVGVGLANTNLIKAAITSNQAACNWKNFTSVFPIIGEANIKARTYTTETYNYFCIASGADGITFTNTANVEEQLTVANFANAASFVTYDFTNVWSINDTPTLISNPTSIYSLIPISVNVTQTGKTINYTLQTSMYNSTDYSVVVTNTSDNSVLYSGVGTSGNIPLNLQNDITVLFAISIFNTPYPTANTTYFYYSIAQIAETTIALSNKVTLQQTGSINPTFTSLKAIHVHGSVAYNGKTYGIVRNDTISSVQLSASCLAVINENGSFTLKEITAGPNYNASCVIVQFESLCRIGTRLFAIGQLSIFNTFNPNFGNNPVLFMYDTVTEDYKLFKLQMEAAESIAPLHAAGNYLYLNTRLKCHKFDPTPLFNVSNKYYLDTELQIPGINTSGVTYDSSLVGGYITNPTVNYSATDKGYPHSVTNDATTLYVAYITGQPSGYKSTIGRSVCEVHAIDIATMTNVGWAYIPFSTDDMTIINKHLVFGVEVLSTDNVAAFGYGKSIAKLAISDLKANSHNATICMAPLHVSDNPSVVQSYACLNLGNYIFDFRTNKKVYIIDATNIQNWSATDPIGKYTIKVLNFTSGNAPISLPMNEGMLMEDNSISTFLWGAPSEYARFTIPDLELNKTLGYIGNTKIIKAYINNQQITKIL